MIVVAAHLVLFTVLSLLGIELVKFTARAPHWWLGALGGLGATTLMAGAFLSLGWWR